MPLKGTMFTSKPIFYVCIIEKKNYHFEKDYFVFLCNCLTFYLHHVLFCSYCRTTSSSLCFVFTCSLYLWLSLSLPQAFELLYDSKAVALKIWIEPQMVCGSVCGKRWSRELICQLEILIKNIQDSSYGDLNLSLWSLPFYRESNTSGLQPLRSSWVPVAFFNPFPILFIRSKCLSLFILILQHFPYSLFAKSLRKIPISDNIQYAEKYRYELLSVTPLIIDDLTNNFEIYH